MSYQRIVAKLGTSLLTSGTEHLDLQIMANLAKQVAQLHHQDKEIVIVSSGAIAAGRQKLEKIPESKNTSFKQVLASVGQSHLMHSYEELFSQHNIIIAQALLTKADMSDRSGYLNARNTLLTLIELGVICIVNENDVVSIDEIGEMKFGDNDNLSAMVANLIDADLLVLLTDVAGLYTADPRYNPHAKLIPRVDNIDGTLEQLAYNTSNQQGTGGMTTKIQAARLATSSGTNVIIVNGREPDVLIRLDKGESIGTFFPAQVNKMESKKRWMLTGLASKGMIIVDQGAALALKEHNKSLLPAGIIEVRGNFQRGDTVDVFDKQANHLACGISNYEFNDVALIKGVHSNQISAILDHNYGDEVIHRNNMVVL
ncbi:MAG: glutamate 5-kinase [Chloroflexota bacterium]|nr:glutamate 5-kinase [Chloroflexota bacterium]